MVDVVIFRNKDGHMIRFSVTGHADMAPRGEDIVCAGISALTQAAVIGLEKYVGSRLEVKVESGELTMKLLNVPDLQTNAILETMLFGLSEIAQNYPKSVHIREHRR